METFLSETSLRKIQQEYVENCEMWCWRRTDEDVLRTVNEERSILTTSRRRKTEDNKWSRKKENPVLNSGDLKADKRY